jgi:hypothetical protein
MTRIACFIGDKWGIYFDIYYACTLKDFLPKLGFTFAKPGSLGLYLLFFFIGIRNAEWGTGLALGLTFGFVEIGVTYEHAEN